MDLICRYLVLFCKTTEEAEQILNIINTTCNRFGLTISFKKTKTQVFNNKELAKKLSLLTIQGQQLENVMDFTYLGYVITSDETKCFTEHRIACATSKFNEFNKMLTDNTIHMKTRRKILEACVRSRLTYGTQAAPPNEKELKTLEGSWYPLLRHMINGGWARKDRNVQEEENYSYRYTNKEVEGIVGTMPLRNIIHQQYLKYIAHICRSPNTAITKKMLFAKPIKTYYRDPWLKIAELLGVSTDQAKRLTQSRGEFAELVRQ